MSTILRTPLQCKQFDDIQKAFEHAKALIEKLPPTRMRSLAITDLESSFSRAVFAVSELEDPIRAR